MNRKSLVLLICCFLFFKNAFAQIEENKQPLIEVLKIIETRFNVNFTYVDNTVNTIFVETPSANLNLDDTLNYLSSETKLFFEVLNNTDIIIRDTTVPLKSFKLHILNEIVINKYLIKGISKYSDGSILLNPQDFGILPGLIEPDVLQTIQALPGVQSVNETVSNLNIRGSTHDQNLILWDGIKMYQSGHFFGLISAFNPYLTTDVKVIKNGTSAFYGDGVSSIINMHSKNTITNKFSAGVGSNLINADAFLVIPTSKNTELQLSVRRAITDIINTPTYDQYFKRISQDSDLSNDTQNTSISTNANFYFYDASLKFLYDITEDDMLRVNFLTTNNNLEYLETAISTNSADNESLNSGLSQSNLAGSLSYNRKWNSVFSSYAESYISTYDLDATNFDLINNQRLIQENQVIDLGLKLGSSYKLIDQNTTLSAGYQFSEVGISNLADVNNPIFRSFIKEVVRTHSVFAQANYKSESGKTYINTGIRSNYFSKLNTLLIEPRLSLSQKITNNLKIELLGEFKSQTTSQIIDRQNDFLGIEKRRWVLSNNDSIPIIKSKQLSTGLSYNKNKLLINVEAYLKQVADITTRSQGFQNQYQFVNAIGDYEVKGIDLLVNKQFSNLSTWLSYSYSKNDYTFKTLNEGKSFANNVDTRHAISFAGTYNYNDQLQLALGVNWRSGIPTTNPQIDTNIIDGNINYESPNSSNLDDYFRTDFSATYNFKLSKYAKAKAGFSLLNILNQKNTINTYYTIDNDNSISKIDNQSLSITPNVSFRVRF